MNDKINFAVKCPVCGTELWRAKSMDRLLALQFITECEPDEGGCGATLVTTINFSYNSVAIPIPSDPARIPELKAMVRRELGIET